MSRARKTLDVVQVKLVLDRKLYSDIPLTTPDAVYEVMKRELREYDREVFCILNMDTKGHCLNMNVVSMGTINETLISPREVFKSAILSNANHIILLHNHPSGIAEPSQEDIHVTRRMENCGKLLGVPVCDHLIIGGINGELYSFAEHGLMDTASLYEAKQTKLVKEKTDRKQEKIL